CERTRSIHMQTSGQTSSPQPPKPRTPKARPPKPVPPPEFDAGKIMAMQEADLIALLKKGDASEFEKAKACQRLSMVGTDAAVPAVAPLLTDTKLSHYARYALETIPGSVPDEALRAALPKVKGDVLVGVVNSIGKRGDAGAVDALTKLTNGPDENTARAAASALGHIGSPEAARAIQSALGETKDPVR